MQLITVSRLAAFRRCSQYHHLKYDELITPRTDSEGVRSWGSAMHLALEAWWVAMSTESEEWRDAALGIALDAIRTAPTLNDFDRARARAAMIGYHHRWIAQEFEILGVEIQFDHALVNPDSGAAGKLFRVGGKIDAIVRRPDGQTWLVEHKTTSIGIEPGGPYWQRLRLDAQISTYLDGARALGHEPAGCIYDVIQRPGIKPRKATSVDDRKFTAGKGCKVCDGTHGGKSGVMRGSGTIGIAADHDWYFPDDDGKDPPLAPMCKRCGEERTDIVPSNCGPLPCGDCSGSGWFEAPRLHANQRETDETPDEFFERCADAIGADPSAFYIRGDVVRTPDEMHRARREIWKTAKSLRATQREQLSVRNPDACMKFGSVCEYFQLCAGEADTDGTRYTRADRAHPELDL